MEHLFPGLEEAGFKRLADSLGKDGGLHGQ
jgi:hypothetical protein